MRAEFEIRRTADDAYEWRLRSSTGQVAATGGGYPTLDAAVEGAEALQDAVGGAAIIDATGESSVSGYGGDAA